MPFYTAPALLAGLGARILLDKFSQSDESHIKDLFLMGAWQGVALHYSTTFSNSNIPISAAFLIGFKTFIEFRFGLDATKVVTTLAGVLSGFVCTDFLSQHVDTAHLPTGQKRRKKRTLSSLPTRPQSEHDHEELPVPGNPTIDEASVVTSSFTEHTLATTSHRSHHSSNMPPVSSTLEEPSSSSFTTPHEREIRLLQTRAILANNERRRLKEERKHAISQGNMARASQLKWEVRRFAALIETFNREASSRVAEATPFSSVNNQRPYIQKPTTSAMKDVSHQNETSNPQRGSATTRISHKPTDG